MAFSGTLVSAGQGKGVVVATGRDTEIGRISGMLASVEVLTTPLVAQMAVLAKWLTILILFAAALLLAYGAIVRHYDFEELFMVVVGLSVAAIPESLPAVLTVTLAIGVRAMARRNAIVRRLPAIETLGSVSVICTDKTGTLTRNEMTVATVATAEGDFTVTGDGRGFGGDIRLDGRPVDPPAHATLLRLAEAAVICNDASLVGGRRSFTVDGDPMEGALIVFARKAGFGHEHGWIAARRDPLRCPPSLHGDPQPRPPTGGRWCSSRARRSGFSACARPSRARRAGHGRSIADHWHRKAHAIADRGERVLALAAKDASGDQDALGFDHVGGRARAARPGRADRPAAARGHRGGGRVPRGRHRRQDDHRRPCPHRGGDRPAGRSRQRRSRRHRQRDRCP